MDSCLVLNKSVLTQLDTKTSNLSGGIANNRMFVYLTLKISESNAVVVCLVEQGWVYFSVEFTNIILAFLFFVTCNPQMQKLMSCLCHWQCFSQLRNKGPW